MRDVRRSNSSGSLRTASGVLLRLAVLFHVVAITSWSIPTAPNAVANGRAKPYGTDWLLLYNDRYIRTSAVRPYLYWTGFWQVWDMFSPDPSDTDFWGDAEVVYADGSIARYRYPRMYELPISEKYCKERYRKFFERAHADAFSYLWPAFAQRVALESVIDPKNLPTTVRLHRHFMPLPKPGQAMPETYSDVVYFEYEVDQAALRESLKGR